MRNVFRCKYPYLGVYVNSYIVEAGNKTLLIDSGLASGRDKLISYANHNTALLSTHGHWDHVGNHRFLQAQGVWVYAHAGDGYYYSNLDWQWEIQFEQFASDFDLPPARRITYMAEFDEPLRPDVYLQNGDHLTIGDSFVEVIATPGHSDGSVCFLMPEDGFLFTGDTLMGEGFFGGCPQCTDPKAYKHSMETLKNLHVKTVFCDHNDPISGEKLAEKADAGIACMDQIGRRIDTFLSKYKGSAEALLRNAVSDVCRAEGKKPGGGACVTVLAYLRQYPDHPAAKACLAMHTPL